MSFFAALFDLALPEFLAILLLGAGLGFFGGLFGIGGGIIAIPLLGLGFHMEQSLAQGTALVLMVPNLLIGWWRYTRRHPVPWQAALTIGGTASLTTWILAGLATRLDPMCLRICFALFMLLLGLRLGWGGRRKTAADATPVDACPACHLPWVGFLGGSSMGLLGIGGGLVATPILVTCLRLRQTVAQSLSLALVAPSSLLALGRYAQAERVDWSLGVPLALGGFLTVAWGVSLAHRLPERQMQRAFAGLLLATGLWMGLGVFWFA